MFLFKFTKINFLNQNVYLMKDINVLNHLLDLIKYILNLKLIP